MQSYKCSSPEESEKLFLAFCEESDREQAIRIATVLVDEYKLNGNLESILRLSNQFIRKFKEPTASTSSFMIMKEGINAAIQLVENITEDLPSDEAATLVCANMICLPLCYNDADFMLSAIERITACYNSEYESQLIVIAHFLPALEKCFVMLREWFESLVDVGNLDREAIVGLVEVCKEYERLLLNEDAPILAEGGTPYRLDADTKKIEYYLEMIREEEALAAEILNITDETIHILPHLKERREKLLEYYLNVATDDLNILDIEITYHIVSCFAMWRELDIVYVISNIEPYAQKLIGYNIETFISTGIIYSMQTVLADLANVYEVAGNSENQYLCYIKNMQLNNLYFKRICFEHGLEHFLETVKVEYVYYHSILAKALYLATTNDYSVNELYFELCKRKNLIYLGEMWQRQGTNLVEISKLLEREFSFEELRIAVGNDRALIDFFYIRINSENKDTQRGSLIDSRKDFACFAFTLFPYDDVQFYLVDKGTELAENICNYEDSTDYFKNIAEYILKKQPETECLIVCADGDVNQINVAALPYLDGYITDYYAVRNIGSVLDIMYPSEKKPIDSALIFNAPDYGTCNTTGPDSGLRYLYGSEWEGQIITDTLTGISDIAVDCLCGYAASKTGLKNGLGNKYGILHISTHGEIADGKISIVASGANLPESDSLISDSDISCYSLENTSVAVFALCFGAKQLLSLQDSLSGFIKVSLLTGVNSIIAPIKPIDDFSTVILLNEFYKSYLSNQSDNGNAEHALREAIYRTRTMSRQELLQEYNIELDTDEEYPFSEPKHWSPWVCYSKERKW